LHSSGYERLSVVPSPLSSYQSSTPPSLPSPPSRYPNIKGIDFNAGLHRWGNNRKVYVGALKQFAKEHAQDTKKLTKYVSCKDYKKLEQLAHAIKGVAKNVSAIDLSYSVARLEKVASQSDSKEIKARVLEVNKALENVFKNIEELETENIDDEPKLTLSKQIIELTESEFFEILEKLKICIEKGENVDAVNLAQQLIQGGSSDKLTEEFEILINQLENFDFSDAVATLSRILNKVHGV